MQQSRLEKVFEGSRMCNEILFKAVSLLQKPDAWFTVADLYSAIETEDLSYAKPFLFFHCLDYLQRLDLLAVSLDDHVFFPSEQIAARVAQYYSEAQDVAKLNAIDWEHYVSRGESAA
jgi:hypothetical protein